MLGWLTWLIHELELTLPAFVHRWILRAKDTLRLFVSPRLAIYRWEGEEKDNPLTVRCVAMDMTRQQWKGILFSSPPRETRVGTIPFWNLDRLAGEEDLLIVEAPTFLSRNWSRRRSLILPSFVMQALDLRGGWERVQDRFRREARKNDLRMVRIHDYQYEMTRDVARLDLYYERIYQPSVVKRYGERTSMMTRRNAMQYLRHGFLFLVRKGSTVVSGSLCHRVGKVLHYDSAGVWEADEQLFRDGAQGAAIHAMIHWGSTHGFRELNFGGTEPLLSSGLFQYKRKWGSVVEVPKWLKRRVWVRFIRVNEVLVKMLERNIFIVEGSGSRLFGLLFDGELPASDRKQLVRRFQTPGISGLLLRVPDDLLGSAEDLCRHDSGREISFDDDPPGATSARGAG
jgi:hypothetical protein